MPYDGSYENGNEKGWCASDFGPKNFSTMVLK